MSRFHAFSRTGSLILGLAALLPFGTAAAQSRERAPASRSVDPPAAQPPAGPSNPAPITRDFRDASPGMVTNPDGRGPASGGGNPNVERGMQRPGPTGGDYHGVRPLVAPRPLPRCTVMPDSHYWSRRSRDLQREIQWMFRRGSIQVHPLEDTVAEFTDWAPYPACWKAYGVAVPAGEKVHFRLNHPSEGWFSVRMMDKWGQLEAGMLQNLIPTGNPEVSYKNLTDKPRAVYILVDDAGWMSSKDNSYRIVITRSWDPKAKGTDLVPFVQGIWAVKAPEEDQAKPKEQPKVTPPPAKQG